MSDYLPFEIQAEIIKRLPIKSLIQFRSVSKPWKSLIDSPRFIAGYGGQVQHLLVRYSDHDSHDDEYFSIVDDNTFPHQKVSLTAPLLTSLKFFRMIGISHGLLCLYNSITDTVVLWNISIDKTIAVVVPHVGERIFGPAIGFGVCRENTDTKIVKIAYVDPEKGTGMESVTSIPYQVEVFTLSTGAWRSPHGNLPRKSIHFEPLPYYELAMDGVFYWLATDGITMDGEYKLIVSFDMTSEEFREITLPDSLAHPSHLLLSLSKLKESLVVLEYDEWVMEDFVVWMMVDGTPESFTKLFTIAPNKDVLVSGFRKNGEPIIEFSEQGDYHGQLAVYEPYSKHIENLGIDVRGDSFSVHPYMETLLLLDQPNFIVYDGILRRRAKKKRLLKHTRKI